MKKVIILNKKEGETPLEALENFRKDKAEYFNVSMTYAGRLDPLAKGVLVILAGSEIKNKEKYLNLEKEYVFEIFFGFSTDTYDVLGKIINKKNVSISKNELKTKLKENIKNFLGETLQRYPMYSSKTLKGKPLFMYARKGESVDIPERKIFVKKLELEKITNIDNKKLFKKIEKKIEKVKGDFRQRKILSIWKKELFKEGLDKEKFFIANFKIKCSSGTYVRGISDSLGKMINLPALAFSIKRTKVGKYMI